MKKEIRKIGFLLSLIAGTVNGFFLYHFGETISHHTGNLTKIGLFFSEKPEVFKISLILIFVFLGGGITNSLILGKYSLKNSRKFVRSFFLLAMISFILSFFSLNEKILYILTFLMGFQGSLDFTFDGMPVRTVHMTGYLSDIGKFTGQFLKGNKENLEKLLLLIVSFFLFLMGAFFSFLLSEKLNLIFFFIGILYLLCGIIVKRI